MRSGSRSEQEYISTNNMKNNRIWASPSKWHMLDKPRTTEAGDLIATITVRRFVFAGRGANGHCELGPTVNVSQQDLQIRRWNTVSRERYTIVDLCTRNLSLICLRWALTPRYLFGSCLIHHSYLMFQSACYKLFLVYERSQRDRSATKTGRKYCVSSRPRGFVTA